MRKKKASLVVRLVDPDAELDLAVDDLVSEPNQPAHPTAHPAASPPLVLVSMRDPGKMHADLEAFLDSYIAAMKLAGVAPKVEEVHALVDKLVAVVKELDGPVCTIAVGGVMRMLLAHLARTVKTSELAMGKGSELVQ